MEVKKFYKKLYELQDSVMQRVFAISNEFYLTGGTCLSRFYKECRFSDDLDFFTNFSNIFNLEVKLIREELAKDLHVVTQVETRDFIRFMIENSLQVDFVNDRVKHCGKVIRKDSVVIDNIENIFANKLTAIIGRDSAKDVFDVFIMDKYFEIDYEKVLKCAKEKMLFGLEDLIYRLKTFPTELLDELYIVDRSCLEDFDLKPIIEKIKDFGV